MSKANEDDFMSRIKEIRKNLKYFMLKSMSEYFSGVVAINDIGSELKINFNTTDPDFMILIDKYMKKYDEISESLKNQEQHKLR